MGVAALADELLRAIDGLGTAPTPEALLEIKGIGGAKASQLCAALEFARRRL